MHACTHISLWVFRLLTPCDSCGILECSYKQPAVEALMDASALSCCLDKQSVEWSFNCLCVPQACENPLRPSFWGLVVITKPISMLFAKTKKSSTLVQWSFVFVVVFWWIWDIQVHFNYFCVYCCVCPQKPMHCLNVDVIVEEGLEGYSGGVFHNHTSLQRDVIPVRMTGCKYIITRRDSLQSEHRSIRNWGQECRLIAMCRQFHFVRYHIYSAWLDVSCIKFTIIMTRAHDGPH